MCLKTLSSKMTASKSKGERLSDVIHSYTQMARRKLNVNTLNCIQNITIFI